MEHQCDVVVLGAGPAGYPAAFRAADLGQKVVLVDPEANPGGVCLYRGCIPSKALLHIAALIDEAEESAEWGVTFSKPKIDIDKIRAYKDQVVTKMTSGTGMLRKARNIQHVQGYGSFVDANTLSVKNTEDNEETIKFKHAIIATGSRPTVLPHLDLDSPRVIDSTGALELKDIPKTMLCIGGGIIGMELATVYAALGSKVSVVEMMPNLLGPTDPEFTRILLKRMKSRLGDVMTSTKVLGLKEVKGGIEVEFEGAKVKETKQVFEKVLVCIGRIPNSKNLGLEKIGITPNERGFISVDSQCRTNVPNIFAIGDIVGQPMLAHKGTHEAHVAAEVIAGHKVQFAPKTIPSVVYTNPEIAWCGVTEQEAEAQGLNYEVAKFPWAASGRATALSRTDGLTKMIFEKDTGRVLGVGIAGVGAGELIGEGILAVEMATTAKDIALSIHAHPTTTETLMECAELFLGHCDHYIAPRKKK